MVSFIFVVAALMCQTGRANAALQDDSAAMIQHSHASRVESISHKSNETDTERAVVGSTSCGSGMTVGSIGCSMDQKVNGIANGYSWSIGCAECGSYLQDDEGLIGGCHWYCEQAGRDGIWLKGCRSASSTWTNC